MRYTLTGILAALVVPGLASAQFRGGPGGRPAHAGPAMRGGVPHAPGGGGFRIIQAPPLPRSPGFGLGVGTGSGYYPGYGFGGGYGLRGGYGYGYGGYGYGGFISDGYTSGYTPYYVLPQPTYLPGGGPGYVPSDSVPAGLVSGVLPATLVIQFPAPARVWLDGVAVEGEPDATWTLTSRDLRPGETATFRVRGRRTAGGKTYETSREIPLGPGARSRLLVVSGTEVAE